MINKLDRKFQYYKVSYASLSSFKPHWQIKNIQSKILKHEDLVRQNPSLSPQNQNHVKNIENKTLNRYSSEDFFKFNKQIYSPISSKNKNKQYMINKVQNQNRRKSNVFDGIFNHKSQKIQQIEQQPEQIQEFIEKKFFYMEKIKFNTSQRNSHKRINLKQTSSTIGVDNHVTNASIFPSFLKKNTQFKLKTKKRTISKDQFWVIRKIGNGKFGNVYLVKDKETGFIMAMKVFDKQRIIKENYLNQFIRELKIQSYLDHPNIINLYGYFDDAYCFYILLEFASDGQLYTLIDKNISLSQETISYIIKQLLLAVQYMHKLKILHRDIKPENIVLNNGIIKICDFGWAVHQKDELRSTYCGTPLYFSPQLLKGGLYDQKVDIWAIGILAYELQVGQAPFNITNKKQLFKIVTQPLKFPQHVSKNFKQFMLKILTKNPSERLKSSQLLKMPFIQIYKGFQTSKQLCNKNLFK